MPEEEHKLLIRLPKSTYLALKRFSTESGWSMTKLINRFCEAIPDKYREDSYE